MQDEIRATREFIKNIDGFLTDREGVALYRLAQTCSNGVIVEIGSWKGKSTIWLGKGGRRADVKTIYAIDHHVGSEEHQAPGVPIWTFQEFENNIQRAGIANIVTPLVKTSAEARPLVRDAVDLLFIDGTHDYESVKQDFRLWSEAVKEGGIIAFHDAPWEGVSRTISEVLETEKFCKAYFCDTLFFVRKTNKATIWNQFGNRLMFLLSCSFYAINASCNPKWKKSFIKNIIKMFRFFINPTPFVHNK